MDDNESKLADYFMLAVDHMKQNFGEEKKQKNIFFILQISDRNCSGTK